MDVGVVEIVSKEADGKSVRMKYEIDFVANLGSRRIYIQSAYAVSNADKLQQESRSLLLTDDSFRKIMIVHDPVVPHHMENGILIMSIYDFLLGDESLEIA